MTEAVKKLDGQVEKLQGKIHTEFKTIHTEFKIIHTEFKTLGAKIEKHDSMMVVAWRMLLVPVQSECPVQFTVYLTNIW